MITRLLNRLLSPGANGKIDSFKALKFTPENSNPNKF